MTAKSQAAAQRAVVLAERAAVHRVLRLVDGYLSTRQQDTLVAWRGGMMTWRELRRHVKAALRLQFLAAARKGRK